MIMFKKYSMNGFARVEYFGSRGYVKFNIAYSNEGSCPKFIDISDLCANGVHYVNNLKF